MYFQTIEVARGMVHSMIADADRAHGGPANATVRSSEFIPNCLNRIEQLLGAITVYKRPTQAQIDAVEACIALPLCSGLDSSGILRQRAIENSVMQMWSHLYAKSAISYQVGDKVRYLGVPMPLIEGGKKWGGHLVAGEVYEVEEIGHTGNIVVKEIFMNPKAFERAQ